MWVEGRGVCVCVCLLDYNLLITTLERDRYSCKELLSHASEELDLGQCGIQVVWCGGVGVGIWYVPQT